MRLVDDKSLRLPNGEDLTVATIRALIFIDRRCEPDASICAIEFSIKLLSWRVLLRHPCFNALCGAAPGANESRFGSEVFRPMSLR